MICRMLVTFYVKAELVSSISKRDLGDSDAAGREEEEEDMAGHGWPLHPEEVNHGCVQGLRRNRGTSHLVGNSNW